MEQDFYQVSSQYTPSSTRGSKGCSSIFFIILLIILLVPAYFFVISPNLFPNKIRGEFLDAVYVPGKDGAKGFLWIQTDGSFHYVQETHTPGSYSMGRKGLFCKTWTYLYDPVGKKVIKDFKTPYDEIPPTPKMFYREGMVWIVSPQQFSYDPIINVYDAETGELVMNTDGFIKKFPELSSGLTKLRVEEDPKRFDLDTKDGGKFIYSVDENKMYSSDKEYNDAHGKLSQDTVSIFAMGSESSSPRKILYRLTGPAGELSGKSISESTLKDSSSVRFFYHSSVIALNPGKVYLEGIILYQDNESAVILHQTSAGKKADRILTCVTSAGKELWTLPQDQLFPDMGVNEDKDPFSKIFFMKDKFSAARQGNIVIFKFLEEGMIGIDFKTGKKLWELDI
jgi:hypothetical protein